MTKKENAPVLNYNHRCSGGDNRGAASAEARERFALPHYHEGEQMDKPTVEVKPVREEELSSHF